MSIKKYKPITPSLRNMVKIVKPKTISIEERKELKKLGLIKNRVSKHSGRNHSGKITVRHQGGGHKRLYRNIDRERVYGNYSLNRVERIDYNPSSSGFLALISPVTPSEGVLVNDIRSWPSGSAPARRPYGGAVYAGATVSTTGFEERNTKKWYILAAEGMKEGDLVPGDRLSDISIEGKDEQRTMGERSQQHSLGQSLKLKDMIIGTNFYNLDGKFIRSAGTFGIVLKHFESESFIDKLETKKKGTSSDLTMIKLPSGKIITISSELKATVGRVSNIDNYKQVKGKAGVNRWLGIRPTVRGEAMNPIDHPHGGKSHGSGGLGNPLKNKWGKLAKWVKTVKKS